MTMQSQAEVLHALAKGLDPSSGEALEATGVWREPGIAEALRAGAAALEARARVTARAAVGLRAREVDAAPAALRLTRRAAQLAHAVDAVVSERAGVAARAAVLIVGAKIRAADRGARARCVTHARITHAAVWNGGHAGGVARSALDLADAARAHLPVRTRVVARAAVGAVDVGVGAGLAAAGLTHR